MLKISSKCQISTLPYFIDVMNFRLVDKPAATFQAMKNDATYVSMRVFVSNEDILSI